VDSVIVEDGRAAGLELRRGGEIRARRAVVSNATIWDTQRLIPEGALPQEYREECATAPQCESILHLHLGIDATGLPDDLGIHHVWLRSWDVTAPLNMCNICIPSTLDPDLAPPGHHVVHAYTAGNEPYDVWRGLHHKSAEYEARKAERVEVLWQAMEKVIPDVRDRTKLALVGTPLTHERFLRRHRGTYGAAFRADEGKVFPGGVPGTLDAAAGALLLRRLQHAGGRRTCGRDEWNDRRRRSGDSGRFVKARPHGCGRYAAHRRSPASNRL
jgi:phytoene dehydrogenase-like protein